MMKHSVRILLVVCLAAAGLTVAAPMAGASVPTPSIDYQFAGSLVDSAGGSVATPSPACPANPCIATSGFGTNASGPYWQWTSTSVQAGGGLRVLTNAPLGDTYTLILKFALDQTGPGYKKVMDFKDGTDDTGFYFYNRYLYFYNLGSYSPGTYADGAEMDLIVVRQSTGGTAGQFTVYTKTGSGPREELINISDPTGQSIFSLVGSQSVVGLFYNDTLYNEGSEGGKAYKFQAWSNVALTPEQLDEALAPPAPDPTPTPDPTPEPITPTFTG